MDNVSKWTFVCPKCRKPHVRLKNLLNGFQNICEGCGWRGILAKATHLTEELQEAQAKTVVPNE